MRVGSLTSYVRVTVVSPAGRSWTSVKQYKVSCVRCVRFRDACSFHKLVPINVNFEWLNSDILDREISSENVSWMRKFTWLLQTLIIASTTVMLSQPHSSANYTRSLEALRGTIDQYCPSHSIVKRPHKTKNITAYRVSNKTAWKWQ